MAIGHAGHEKTQPQPLGPAGDETQSGIALEHRVFRRRHPVHLEVVVHEREGADADGLGPLGQLGDTRPDARRTAGPVESRDVEVEFHTSGSTTPDDAAAVESAAGPQLFQVTGRPSA